jgi:hypothetical protein
MCGKALPYREAFNNVRGYASRRESTIDRNGEDVCLLFTKSEMDYHDNEEELSSLQLLLSSA